MREISHYVSACGSTIRGAQIVVAGEIMLKPFSLAKYFYVSLVVACIGSVGCSADDDFDSEETMNQENLSADNEQIAVEAEAIKDASWIDPKILAEGDYESPMPILDSVDEVSLTSEEEERAIDEAREKEKHTKAPRGPKTPPSKD